MRCETKSDTPRAEVTVVLGTPSIFRAMVVIGIGRQRWTIAGKGGKSAELTMAPVLRTRPSTFAGPATSFTPCRISSW